jgi:hypothetical protein
MEVEMTKIKSLLLGTAAGLLAVGGAQAADMPVKAAPVQYVKICSLYGDGFYYIPGTDKAAICVSRPNTMPAAAAFPSATAPAAWQDRAGSPAT